MTPDAPQAEAHAERARTIAAKALAKLSRAYSSAERDDIQGAVEEAFADAEAAERPTWAEYEMERDAFDEAAQVHGWESDQGHGSRPDEAEAEWQTARATLDALVRRLIAAPPD